MNDASGSVAHYATRNDVFARPVVWTLAGAELRCDDGAGPPRVIALGEMAEVRLEYAPTRAEPNRFRCRLRLRRGEEREFFNRTCAGVLDFRDTSAGYAAFVRALHAALARHAPECRFVAGATPARYTASVIAAGFAALMVGVAALFLVFNGLAWVILLKLALMAIFLPNVFRWLARNRPRAYGPTAIPPEALPTALAEKVQA